MADEALDAVVTLRFDRMVFDRVAGDERRQRVLRAAFDTIPRA